MFSVSCILCLCIVLCNVSFCMYSCLFPIFVQVYWSLQMGENSTAVNKYRIVSYHIISYHIISYHIISYIISYHIISYHIISYHTIPYHIIYYHIYHMSDMTSAAHRRDVCNTLRMKNIPCLF